MYRFFNPKNYIGPGLSLTNRHLLRYAEKFLSPSFLKPLDYPPIFFLGAPRSGSTVAIQVMTSALDLGYISNKHCQFFGAPALAEMLLKPLDNKPCSDFRSYHGVTKNFSAPSECGEWWYRFFTRNPAYVTLQDVNPVKMKEFRRSLASMTKAFDKPILFKNLYASFRIKAIVEYIPESLFIIMHRNELDNAHSLLETRMNVFKTYDEWWSMEPPTIETLKRLPVHVQVVEQIRHIQAIIEKDLSQMKVPESRVFHLNYESLCEDTHGMLSKLENFLNLNKCDIKRTGEVPKNLRRSNKIRIDPDLYSKLERYANSF